MHELSICQALMTQVETVALENQASKVTRITLGLGPLSGVEESLLRHAYPVASAGTLAEDAELLIRPMAIRVKCSNCGKESDATPNRLLCGHCKDWQTKLVSGDELLLMQLELEKPDGPASMPGTI